MKRFLSFAIMMAMVMGLLPAAHAAQSPERWEAVKRQCREQGLQVTWYPYEEGIIRRYGTDRKLMVSGGQSYLSLLGRDYYWTGPFDAFGEFNEDGLAPACKNGKWGVVNLQGDTVVDFQYPAQAQAETAGGLAPVSRERVDEDALHEGLRRVQEGERGPWGFVNGAEELVVPHLFDAVGYFDYGYASVMVDGVFGLLPNPLLAPAAPETPAADVTFTDVPAGSWFEQGVMTCARAGIMVGVGEGTFLPNASLTDAECLMLAYRLYDQARGGDGSVLKMPEEFGYLKLASEDGSFVHEGYIGDRTVWDMPVVYSSHDGPRLSPVCDTPVPKGPATVTYGGEEYRGVIEGGHRGSGRYPMDNFIVFDPEDSAFNELVQSAHYHSAPPGCWWSDLLYTIHQKGWSGWDSVFASSLFLLGDEEWRGGFAELLGAVTELPKRFDVPPIPDEKELGESSYHDNIIELYEAGVIGGVDAYGTMGSEKTLTRAEAAVMVARIIDPAQRLTAPPKPMPKEGEGYTLTYLMDGTVDGSFDHDTYPYYFVEDMSYEIPYHHRGFLKLDGSFDPWPETDADFFTLERFGGSEIYWDNYYEPETEDGLERHEVGVLNDRLEWIIRPQYAELWPREGGYCAGTGDERYFLLDEKGQVVEEVAQRSDLPGRPHSTRYHEYWDDWKNWGGLWSDNSEPFYYRWSDGSPATEHFDRCGKIGPDGKGFVEKGGKIYRIEFAPLSGA